MKKKFVAFLIEMGERAKIKLISHSYNSTVKDNFRDSGETELHYWNLDRNSNACLVRFTNTPIYCYTGLPQFVKYRDGKSIKITWDETLALRVYQLIDKFMSNKGNAPIGCEFDKKRVLYYYKGNQKIPMLKFSFKTLRALNHYKNIINKPLRIDDMNDVVLTIMEETVDPVLRLNTLRNLGYSQWFEVDAIEISNDDEERISTEGGRDKNNKEYIADWRTIRPISKEESRGWTTTPRKATIDIECRTSNYNQMTDPDRHDNEAYLISVIFAKKGLKEEEKYLLSTVKMNEIKKSKICNMDADIIYADNEVDLIEKFAELIKYLSPEIIDGWNIYGFDFNYLRIRMLKKFGKFPSMGRIKPYIQNGKKMNDEEFFIIKEWRSSGFGNNKFCFPTADGTICLDELLSAKRLFKYDKYTLDFCSKEILKDKELTKHGISAKEMFRRYDNSMACEKAYKRFLKGRKSKISEKELINNLQIARAEMTEVGIYCLQDSILVHKIFSKINLWIDLVEMSNVAGVTVSDVTTKGQQVRSFSKIYNKAFRENVVINTRVMPKMVYSGGFVGHPDVGLRDNIITLDFTGLYPSIIIALNICYTTLIHEDDWDSVPDGDFFAVIFYQDEPISGVVKTKTENDDMPEFDGVEDDYLDDDEAELEKDEDIDIENMTEEKYTELFTKYFNFKKKSTKKKKDDKTVAVRHEYRFVTAAVRKGILPMVCEELSAARKDANKQLKKLKGHAENLSILRKDVIDVAKLSNEQLAIFKDKPEKILDKLTDDQIKELNSYNLELESLYLDLKEKKDKLQNQYNEFENIYKKCVFETKEYDRSYVKLIEHYNKEFLKTIDSYESKIKFDLMDSNMDSYYECKNNLIAHINKIDDSDDLLNLLKNKTPLIKEYRDKVELLSQVSAKYIDTNNKNYGFEDYRTKQYLDLKNFLGKIIQLLKFSEVNNTAEEKQKLIKKKLIKREELVIKISELEIITSYHKEGSDIENIDDNKNLYNSLSDLDQYNKELKSLDTFLEKNKISDIETVDYYEIEIDKLLTLYDGRDDAYDGKIKLIDGELKLLRERIDGLVELKPSSNFMKALNDKIRDILTNCDVMNSYQLAIKMTNNSMYGFIGVQDGGKLPLIEGALSVTAYGRQSIEKVNNYVKEQYGAKIVYNDTDSSMIDLDLKDPRDCEIWGIRLQKEISGVPEIKKRNGKVIPAIKSQCDFPPPMKIEYEKGGRMFAIRKKKYVMYTLKADGTFEIDNKGNKKILKRGITIARRDNCVFVRECYTELLNCIMERESIMKAFGIICKYVIDLLENRVPVDKLVIIKGLGSNYAIETAAMKVFGDQLNRLGQNAVPGDRLSYVIVIPKDDPKSSTLGIKMREYDMYKNAINRIGDEYDPESEYPKEKLDYLFYILHNLMNPIDQIFGIAYKEELKYCSLVHNNQGSSKANIVTPVKYIASFIKMQNKNLDVDTIYKNGLNEIKKLPKMFEERYGGLKDEMIKYAKLVANYFEQVRINNEKHRMRNELQRTEFRNSENDEIIVKKKVVFRNKVVFKKEGEKIKDFF